MTNYYIPLSILLSVLPTIAGLIAIYVKLRSDLIRLESELKNIAFYNAAEKRANERLSEELKVLSEKFINFIIDCSKCKKNM